MIPRQEKKQEPLILEIRTGGISVPPEMVLFILQIPRGSLFTRKMEASWSRFMTQAGESWEKWQEILL